MVKVSLTLRRVLKSLAIRCETLKIHPSRGQGKLSTKFSPNVGQLRRGHQSNWSAHAAGVDMFCAVGALSDIACWTVTVKRLEMSCGELKVAVVNFFSFKLTVKFSIEIILATLTDNVATPNRFNNYRRNRAQRDTHILRASGSNRAIFRQFEEVAIVGEGLDCVKQARPKGRRDLEPPNER